MTQFFIKKPHVTEKSSYLSSFGKYVFMVDQSATSNEVKKGLKKIYNIDVLKVNIINRKPKLGRYGQHKATKARGYKKAIVTVKKGQTIDIGAQ